MQPSQQYFLSVLGQLLFIFELNAAAACLYTDFALNCTAFDVDTIVSAVVPV